jgi:hypothetical protein
MKINWFKLYLSIMILLIVMIFVYREYRLTKYQDFQVWSGAIETCMKLDDDSNYNSCKEKLKEYRIYFKY